MKHYFRWFWDDALISTTESCLCAQCHLRAKRSWTLPSKDISRFSKYFKEIMKILNCRWCTISILSWRWIFCLFMQTLTEWWTSFHLLSWEIQPLFGAFFKPFQVTSLMRVYLICRDIFQESFVVAIKTVLKRVTGIKNKTSILLCIVIQFFNIHIWNEVFALFSSKINGLTIRFSNHLTLWNKSHQTSSFTWTFPPFWW